MHWHSDKCTYLGMHLNHTLILKLLFKVEMKLGCLLKCHCIGNDAFCLFVLELNNTGIVAKKTKRELKLNFNKSQSQYRKDVLRRKHKFKNKESKHEFKTLRSTLEIKRNTTFLFHFSTT